MARLYLVRHGKAEAGWGAAADPGLDDQGRAEAEAMAAALAAKGPLPLVTSPLRRAPETAKPLERRWGAAAVIEPRVGEIPSPVEALDARAEWLRDVMQRRWRDLDPALQAWRRTVVETLAALAADTVVVSHFVAINAAVGAATGDDRVQCFRPANASCTVLDAASGRLTLVELGAEGASRVM
jgi:broad specificity phosphatase PhoE